MQIVNKTARCPLCGCIYFPDAYRCPKCDGNSEEDNESIIGSIPSMLYSATLKTGDQERAKISYQYTFYLDGMKQDKETIIILRN